MHIKRKINLKKFILIGCGPLGISLAFCRTLPEIQTVIAIHLATLVNLFMLTEGVVEMTQQENAAKKSKTTIMFVGQVVILISALTLGVQIMGTRIIIAVLNYVAQIFVLSVSLKNK